MANKRIDEYNPTPAFALTDLIEKERDPAGIKAHEKATLQQLVDFLTTQISTASFQTTALMLASTNFVDGKSYMVIGHNSVSDGNTRFYRFDATDVQAASGLLILIPNYITRPAPGSLIQLVI